MITAPSRAFNDRSEPIDDRDPSDDRTDEEVIAEHKQYLAGLNYKPFPMSEEDEARWDAVNQKRLAEKNQHVHPVFQQVLKRFG